MRKNSAWSFGWWMSGVVAISLSGHPAWAEGATILKEGALITLTRDAILNGVTLPKGSVLKIAAIRKDGGGDLRADIEQVGGEHRIFKAIGAEAIGAMTASATASVPNGDGSQMFKVGAQIPLTHEVVLNDNVFPKGSVLQIEKVLHGGKGKVTRVDLRETSGKLRSMKAVPVEQLMIALASDSVTWPDGAVGTKLQLARDMKVEDVWLGKGTRLVVTHVQPAASGRGVVRVGLREIEGQRRQFDNVSVALLKESGALGTAEGAPK